MQTATPDTSFLLAGLLQGQGISPGVAGGAGNVSQLIENKGKNGLSPFSASFRDSLRQLLADGLGGLNPKLLQAAIEQLPAGPAVNNSPLLPSTQGQELAAADMEALLTQLTFVEAVKPDARDPLAAAENLASVLPGQADTLAAVLKQIKFAANRQGANPEGGPVVAGVEAGLMPELSTVTDRRLLTEKVAAPANSQVSVQPPVLAGRPVPPLMSEQAVALDNVDTPINPEAGQRLSVSPVTVVPPALLERVMMNLNQERQLSAEMSSWSDTQLDSFALLQGVQQGRPATPPAVLDARPVQSFVQTPLGDPQWQQDFSSRVVMLAKGGQAQVAEIRLNPAHMGPVEVRVVINDDQASITFSAQQLGVRDAIETSLPRLREMFTNSGLQLADVAVSDQSFQERRQRHEQQPQDGGHGFVAADLTFDEEAERIVSQLNLATPPLDRRLDLYA